MDELTTIAAMADETIPRGDGDYIERGLMHCGKCHTPKEVVVMSKLFGARTFPCPCECIQAKRDRERLEHEEAQRLARVERNRIAGIPADARDMTFDRDDGQDSELSTIAHRYVDHFDEFKAAGKGLLLYGAPSRGKSFAAACIANALIDQGHRVYMTNFARLHNRLSGMYDGKQEFIDSLRNYDLVVIDDLGAERDTATMIETVHNVVDTLKGRPLIVTTNLTKDQLTKPGEMAQERIVQRLYEHCIPYEVKGPNRRVNKLTENSHYREMLGIGGDQNG